MLFLKLISSFLFVLGGERLADYPTSSATALQAKTLEVCLSPGCVADGADGTLLKLQALAPPGISVVPGACCSLCGNGPIVMDTESNQKYRKVSEKKILEILMEDAALDPNQAAVLESFNLVSEGDEHLEKKDYSKAIEKYSQAMDIGFEAARALEAKRTIIGSSSKEEPPQGLRWVIMARCNEARAKLSLGDSEGAIAAAESANDLSGRTCAPALELVQEACQMRGDDAGERNALMALFDLPEPSKQTTMEANRRRSLGFRLAKLQASATKN
jgi:tetratricopeptide (TPR) repeat protein